MRRSDGTTIIDFDYSWIKGKGYIRKKTVVGKGLHKKRKFLLSLIAEILSCLKDCNWSKIEMIHAYLTLKLHFKV